MISAAAAFLFMSATPVLAENNPQPETKDVQLTSQQKQELSVLYKEMLAQQSIGEYFRLKDFDHEQG